jgi:hypothetical protein
MAESLQTLIRKGAQTAIRRAYIKRRDYAGDYESAWYRVDRIDEVDQVTNWGSVDISLDDEQGVFLSFKISDYNIEFDNSKGFWNSRSDGRSLFADYMSRRLTKLKIETGYEDVDGNEVGVVNTFEGVIDQVEVGTDGTASVSVLDYGYILNQYDIRELNLTGQIKATTLVELIVAYGKVPDYISSCTCTPDQDKDIDLTALEGTFWEVLQQIALTTNSVIYLIADVLTITARSYSGLSDWDFLGVNNDNYTNDVDITKIDKYDDEGVDRIRLKWIDEDTELEVKSTNKRLLNTYNPDPEKIDLSYIADSDDKVDVLEALLEEWQFPRPYIEFTAAYMINQVMPLSRITIDSQGGRYYADGTAGYWDDGATFDGGVWDGDLGAILIYPFAEWGVEGITLDIDNYETNIRARQIDKSTYARLEVDSDSNLLEIDSSGNNLLLEAYGG